MKAIHLLALILFSSGCGLLKKTDKTKARVIQQSEKKKEFNEFVLKSANKETQIFTYWNDSGFFQYQCIKEQTDLAKSAQLKGEEKNLNKKELLTKKSEPIKIWIYLCLVIIVAGCFFIGFKILR